MRDRTLRQVVWGAVAVVTVAGWAAIGYGVWSIIAMLSVTDQIDQRGGSVSQHMVAVRNYGANPVAVNGPCQSACTLILAAPGLCLGPDAVMVLHHPSDNGKPLPPDAYQRWVARMWEFYPEPVRPHFLAAAQTQRLVVLTYDDLLAMGFRGC